MKIYFACPTGKRRDEILESYQHKYGACLTRDVFNNVTASKMHYFFDNGAFSDFRNNQTFDAEKFIEKMYVLESKTRFCRLPMPEFVVVPDIVSRGKESLLYSRKWVEYLDYILPWYEYYLAVQDGMELDEVEEDLKEKRFQGLFVGGTKGWKYKTSEHWVQLAHKYGFKCHIGGVGTPKAITWAKMINADSVDSGIAMIHPKYLKDVLEIENQSLFWSIAD